MRPIEADATTPAAQRKRVIVSMGGKGGVGKTNVMTGLAEWYQDHEIPVTLLDLDTETTAKQLGIAPGTVMSHLFRAAATLRDELAVTETTEDDPCTTTKK